MIRLLGVLVPLVVLAGCGTPEFRVERSACASEWVVKIPPRLEQELYTRIETRQVPTGRTICKPVGATTVCDQIMRSESYSVPAIRTVDRNKPRRDAQISQCARAACVKSFGNPECKA